MVFLIGGKPLEFRFRGLSCIVRGKIPDRRVVPEWSV